MRQHKACVWSSTAIELEWFEAVGFAAVSVALAGKLTVLSVLAICVL